MRVCVFVFMNVFLLKCATFLLGCFESYIFIAIHYYYYYYCYSNRWENLQWFCASVIYRILCLCLCIWMYRSSDSCLCFKAATHNKFNIIFNIVHKIQNASSYSIYKSCFKDLTKHNLIASKPNQFTLSLLPPFFVYVNSIMHALDLLCNC